MSAVSDHNNEEITAGHRPMSVTNDEWNQQTTVDARNVLLTQQSMDVIQRQFSTQPSMKSLHVNPFFLIEDGYQ